MRLRAGSGPSRLASVDLCSLPGGHFPYGRRVSRLNRRRIYRRQHHGNPTTHTSASQPPSVFTPALALKMAVLGLPPPRQQKTRKDGFGGGPDTIVPVYIPATRSRPQWDVFMVVGRPFNVVLFMTSYSQAHMSTSVRRTLIAARQADDRQTQTIGVDIRHVYHAT